MSSSKTSLPFEHRPRNALKFCRPVFYLSVIRFPTRLRHENTDHYLMLLEWKNPQVGLVNAWLILYSPELVLGRRLYLVVFAFSNCPFGNHHLCSWCLSCKTFATFFLLRRLGTSAYACALESRVTAWNWSNLKWKIELTNPGTAVARKTR